MGGLIGGSITKTDHAAKIRGSAMYVGDFSSEGMLHGRVLRSTQARAKIISVNVPPLPEGYYYIDKDNVPACNRVHIVLDDTPVFADGLVEYIGDAIGLLLGPDLSQVSRLMNSVHVEYEALSPVFDMQKSDEVFFDYAYEKGDTTAAFADAEAVFEDKFETGLQDHMCLESNGLIAEYSEGKMHIHGSIQCPYYVHRAVVQVLGFSPEEVSIKQDVIGGSFGEKEDFPSILASQAAVAAYVCRKPVRIVFERQENVKVTSKRHPSLCHYKLAVKDNRVTAMEIKVLYNAGAYTTLSPVVLQRGLIAACGVYNIPNLRVHGQAMKTNIVPSGAFRGFGAPQTFFAVEMMMTHVASALGLDPIEFKLMHVAKQGDQSSTKGRYHFPVPIPQMVEAVRQASDYNKKKAAYAQQSGRFRRGIGMSMVYHGCGFTGNGERDLIKAVAQLHKDAKGNVEALTAITEMGQGVSTVFAKIIAQELQMPPEQVIIKAPDTARVPDSGPTVASRSVMVVGELLRRAAIRLRAEWQDGREQLITEHYKHPEFMIPFDVTKFEGDAYPTYSWAVNALEVEIDTLTGEISIPGAWGSFDVGTPMDKNIVIGQMEGGFLQSIAYAMMEKMTAEEGYIRNNSFSDYIIPTALDIPNLHIMLHIEKYSEGPYGAKGAGELPHVGGAPAVAEAIGNALGVKVNKIPFLPEDVMEVLRNGNN